jgi:outer membrane protein assembly factor BamB
LRCLAGPDLDGDGYRELLVAFTALDQERFTLGKPSNAWSVFVYALSGLDGRTLWWWHEQLPADWDGSLRPLSWGPPGADGWPQLLVPLTRQRTGEPYRTYALTVGTGRLEYFLRDVIARPADLDGNGLPDLYYVYGDHPRLHAVRGQLPTAWKRLGSWHVAADFDGDGIADLVGEPDQPVRAISGRDGQSLWPVSHSPSPRRAGTHLPCLSGLPVRAVKGGPELCVAAPQGDINGDGKPDLLRLGLPINNQAGAGGGWEGWPAAMGLEAFSGADGGTLWSAGNSLYEGFVSTPGRALSMGNMAAPVCFRDASGKSHLAMTVVVGEGLANKRWLVALSGVGGRVLWKQQLYPPEGTSDSSLINLEPAVTVGELGPAGQALLLWVPVGWRPDRSFGFDLRAYGSQTGSLLWSRPLIVDDRAKGLGWTGRLPPPCVGDLYGDGKLAVVFLERGRLVARRVEDGRELWAYPVQHDYALAAAVAPPPVLADFDGKGTRSVCFTRLVRSAHPGPAWEIIVLDGTGKECSRRRSMGTFLGQTLRTHDLAGDGREELLFEQDGRVWATRGDLRPGQEVWSWQPPGDRSDAVELHVKAVEPVAGGRPATVVVWVPSRQALYGVGGKDGRTLWRAPAADTIPVFPADPEALPYAVCSRPGLDTVCSRILPVDTEGRYRLPAGEKRTYEAPPDDPRFLRPLPWWRITDLQVGLPVLVLVALLGVTLALGLLVLPAFLVRMALRRRSPRLCLIPAGYLALLALGLVLLPLNLGNASRPAVALGSLLLALVGLPVVAFIGAAAAWGYRRRWGRLALLATLFFLSAGLLGAIWLGYDVGQMEPGQRYTLGAWYLLGVPGLFITGCLLVLAYLLRGAARLLRRGRPLPPASRLPPAPG